MESIARSVVMNLNYLRFDEPFKIPGKAGFVVPILLRKDVDVRERSYRLLQEVEDKVRIEDTGIVNRTRFTNRSGYPVLVRKGTMLEGKGQPRSPVSSVVLEPTEVPVEIPVNCIYASRPVGHGTSFKPSGVVPSQVYMALGNQGATWQRVSEYSVEQRSRVQRLHGARYAASAIAHVGVDDLVGNVKVLEQFKDEVDEAIAKIPDHVDQLGLAVFSLRGLIGVEVFDSPDTWKALSDSVVKSYRDAWEDESDLVSINTDAAHDILQGFWDRLLSEAEYSQKAITETSETLGVEMTGYVGEAVILNSRNIHLAVARQDKPERRSPFYTQKERFPYTA